MADHDGWVDVLHVGAAGAATGRVLGSTVDAAGAVPTVPHCPCLDSIGSVAGQREPGSGKGSGWCRWLVGVV